MPAKSKAQQRFMGMVHAFNKGELKDSEVSKDIKDAAKSMKKKDTKDFAKTKHKGLPNKVKKEIITKLREMIRLELESCGYTMSAEPPHKKLKSSGGTSPEDRHLKEAHQFTIKYKKKDGDDYYLKLVSVRANDIKDAVRKVLGKIKSKEEKVIVSVSQETKKDYVVEGQRAIKAFGKVHKARNEFLERYAKLKKQLNTLKTESPNNEFLRLEKLLYKFEASFIEQSSKLFGSVSKIAKSNLTESIKMGNFTFESDLGLTYKRGKTIKVTHKKSGKELIIIDKPNVRKEYEKIGFFDANFSSSDIKKAIAIAKKMSGNMTGAVKVIEKMKKGLSKDKQVAKALQTANESVNEEDGIAKGKGVQKIFNIHKDGYGKLGGRMLDSLSAGLFVQLYDKAPDNIKEKMNKMNEKRLYIVIGKMWDKFGKNVRLK